MSLMGWYDLPESLMAGMSWRTHQHTCRTPPISESVTILNASDRKMPTVSRQWFNFPSGTGVSPGEYHWERERTCKVEMTSGDFLWHLYLFFFFPVLFLSSYWKLTFGRPGRYRWKNHWSSSSLTLSALWPPEMCSPLTFSTHTPDKGNVRP